MKPDLVAPAANVVSLMPMMYNARNQGFFPGRRNEGTSGLWSRAKWDEFLSKEGTRKRLQMSGYAKKSGTSMATPMVSGAVCLLLQKEPKLAPKEVKQRLWQAQIYAGPP